MANAGWRLALVHAMAVLALSVGGCHFGAQRTEDFSSVIQRAQEQVFPALVFIKPIQRQLATGELVRQQAFGSGVIISPDGFVVTNSHVVMDSAEIRCVLYSSGQYPAQIMGVDVDTDLALLKLDLPSGHPPLPSASFGDSDAVKEGQFVVALGSPFGFSRSISFGVISSARRYLDHGPYTLWLQTDAAINPGNSGGPLVNERGQVIGINTARIGTGDNIGFAIPSNTVQHVIDELRRNGHVARCYSGIRPQPLKDFERNIFLPQEKGVLVGGVDELSPAAAAGIRAGDLILSCNGQEMHGAYLEDMPAVRTTLMGLTPEEPARIEVQRGSERLELSLTPVRRQQYTVEGLDLELWNCSVQEISKFRTPALTYYVPHGAYVLGVRRPGNALASGLRPGDIFLSINGEPVPSLEALRGIYQRLSTLERGQRVALLEVFRGGYRVYLALDFNRDMKRWSE